MISRRACIGAWATAALSALAACAPTQGAPLPPDAGDYVFEAGPRDSGPAGDAPGDAGGDSAFAYYDAPESEAGNCIVFGPSGPPVDVACDPGTLCDPSGVVPMCTRADAGNEAVPCGNIACYMAAACSGGVCVGMWDEM